MSYSYERLQNAKSIRLLRLEPGCESTTLKASLATHQLESRCSYDCLSYVWGEPDLSEAIFIDDQLFKISKNLHNILLHLRYPDKIRRLWIDAICINQQDDVERSQQVAVMGQ